jgi:hypothetical protein
MHSLPALFTLPMRVNPSRIRSLTVLIFLVAIFAISPLITSRFYTGCAYRRPFQGTSLELWQEPAPPPEYTEIWSTLPSGARDALKRRFMCYEATLTPWWQADSITH